MNLSALLPPFLHPANAVTAAAQTTTTRAMQRMRDRVEAGRLDMHALGLDGLVPRARTRFAAQMQQLVAGEAERAFRACPLPHVDVATFVADVTAALRASLPDGSEVEKLAALLQGWPELLELPPALLDTDSIAHDGEVWVIDASAEPPQQQRRPADGEEVLYFCNGMMTPPHLAKADAEEMSRRTGKPVVLVYSARLGFAPDVLRGLADKLDPFGLVTPNAATDSQSELVYRAAMSGEPTDFICYSRGTIVTRNALVRAHARIYCETLLGALQAGKNPVAAHAEALRTANDRLHNVHVVAAAGAAWSWPPYANLELVTNSTDPVPNAFGLGVLSDPRETCREVFGVDLPWLPGNSSQDILHEPGPLHDPFWAHHFGNVYMDDVLTYV